ncbi:unnamed protein product [Spirodela intermedia]|uniref:Uncharacterized protein n=1 Tax=Spirodela intermedia TaxID=51605 RepID=A0A7I8JNC5_SPIIN|nr:unnamed protein product [Spirodela intermedia]CAA6671658.1 unnamed protein product [Spirodela intermedia]
MAAAFFGSGTFGVSAMVVAVLIAVTSLVGVAFAADAPSPSPRPEGLLCPRRSRLRSSSV